MKKLHNLSAFLYALAGTWLGGLSGAVRIVS